MYEPEAPPLSSSNRKRGEGVASTRLASFSTALNSFTTEKPSSYSIAIAFNCQGILGVS